MSLIRSDNHFHKHPKPAQEYERKLDGAEYVDWASTTEVNAAVNIAYRKNKYFWINAALYHCDDDGTTYRQFSMPEPEIIVLTNETVLAIDWTTREAIYGPFPRNIQVYITDEGVTRLAMVDMRPNALPPSFTTMTLYLPGKPGIVVIS